MKANLRNTLSVLLLVLTVPAAQAQSASAPQTDAETGLVSAPGFPIVKAYCTLCHQQSMEVQENGAGLRVFRMASCRVCAAPPISSGWEGVFLSYAWDVPIGACDALVFSDAHPPNFDGDPA